MHALQVCLRLLRLTQPWCPGGLVTKSVTTQSPWRPTWPRPDGGREHLVTVVTRLGCKFPPSPQKRNTQRDVHTPPHMKALSRGRRHFMLKIIAASDSDCFEGFEVRKRVREQDIHFEIFVQSLLDLTTL